jgi:hypothetical protein
VAASGEFPRPKPPHAGRRVGRPAFLQHRLESFIYELLMTVTEQELRGKGDLYDKLLRTTGEDDCFMTFNYDLQLDRAFERTLGWSAETGYGFNSKRILIRLFFEVAEF